MEANTSTAAFARSAQPVTIAHSILDAPSLSAAISAHWPIEPPQQVELLQHGQNDWYLLQTANNSESGCTRTAAIA
jgi:hypothetical protein